MVWASAQAEAALACLSGDPASAWGCVGIGVSGGTLGIGSKVGGGVSVGLDTTAGVEVKVGTKVFVGVGVSAGA